MQIRVNNNIPTGFPLVTIGDNNYYEPMEQLKTVFNLRHSVFDKLEAIPKLTKAMHSDIKDIFSAEDILILEEIYEDSRLSEEIKSFLKKIVEENIVHQNNAPFKKVSTILQLSDLKNKYTQKTYTTFTKWISLANFGTQKIDTIIKDKIYMPFPCEFNDRFDCQLHLHENEILSLGNNLGQNTPLVKYLHAMTKYSFNVSSFSLNNPLSTNSNHMWGLYGDNGAGIALTYDLDHLIAQVFSNNFTTQPDNFLFFKPVNYVENYNPIQSFKFCLDEYYGKNNKQALSDFFENFVISKTPQWQFEQELRFYKLSLAAYEGFIPKFGGAVTGETCVELLEYIEVSKQKVNHEIIFNRPTSIVLGWNCNIEDENIQKLIQYARTHSIKVIKLDKYVNYSQSKFYSYGI